MGDVQECLIDTDGLNGIGVAGKDCMDLLGNGLVVVHAVINEDEVRTEFLGAA